MQAFDLPRQDWLAEVGRNGISPARRDGAFAISEKCMPVSWDLTIDELASLKTLGDNWDGLGARAPDHELLAAAIGLAYLLQERNMDPPSRVLPGISGNVLFEWQDPDGTYCEVDIDQPFHAEVMLIVPGEPAKHWELPNA